MLDYVYLQTFDFSLSKYLRSTVGQTRPSSLAIINIERSYANRILQESMNKITDIFGKRINIVLKIYILC